MAKVEIDESEFTRLSGLNNVAHAMLQNPEAAKLLEQAQKLVNPNARTPRLDQDAAVQAPIKALETQIADLNKKLAEKADEDAKNHTLNALRQQRDDGIRELRRQGWTDEGIKSVESLMETKGILDPLDAAAIFEKHNPPQTPTMPGSGGAWNFSEAIHDDSDVDLKKLIDTKGEVDSVTDHIARKALNEVRQNQARR